MAYLAGCKRLIATLFLLTHRLALMDIVDHLRDRFGTPNDRPLEWCKDENLTNLIRHITFAEYPATVYGFNAHLNKSYYDRLGISGWDFVHPEDGTRALHLPLFRFWRGHRYELPGDSVWQFDGEYVEEKRNMVGYWKSVEWLTQQRPSRELESIYHY
jgi:hypothetical protein